MKFQPELIPGRLLKRYKRFLADVILESGEKITVHCPNTGRMTGCAEPESSVWLRDSQNPKRKHRFTWELTDTPTGQVCIHSALANHLVREALESGVISELGGYDAIRPEVRFGQEKSRIDFLLQDPDKRSCYVEVKCVTLHEGSGLGRFPDAVSERGAKHLRELAAIALTGVRAVLLFVVQHNGVEKVAPAKSIDPVYARALNEAVSVGVEILAYRAEVSCSGMVLSERVPFYPDL